jgi:EAL domain-containing protein (putative c-di-GMP-specific phosphodiesterase class I)
MINKLIENDSITVYFQPIISIKDKKIFAYESLTRAYDEDGELIMPLYLFEQARKENLSLKLDEHVRKLAILKFKDYYKNDENLLLFLNFESSVIDNNVADNFIEFVESHNINPSNVVIEIKEDSVKDTDSLQMFVKKYRNSGFVIALDDFGTGYSSFDRLALIRPNIVKVDRSIIYDINNNFVNSEILNAVAKMCHKIGAMVVAEGVESRDEILNCMKKDIYLFQGFWFSKPKKDIDNALHKNIANNIEMVGNEYRFRVKEHITKKHKLLRNSQELAKKVMSVLEENGLEDEKAIDDIILQNDKLEAIYMLNELNGVQVGKTAILTEERFLYKPTQDGHDHSLKKYYFIAKESSRGDFLSSNYISKASGNMCRTYSSQIVLNGTKYILCLDVIDIIH